MPTRFEKISTSIMLAIALAVGGKYLFFANAGPRAQANPFQKPLEAQLEDRWQMVDGVALPKLSTTSTSIIVTEFIDRECPFCAIYRLTLDSLESVLGDSIQLRYVNMPIGGHKFARSGAVATECAFRTPYGPQFVAAAYQVQDSIGFWSWSRIAHRAGIRDTGEFNVCLTEPAISIAVDSARSIARRLKIGGTPTIMVNNWRYDTPPELPRLLEDIRRIASGRKPQS